MNVPRQLFVVNSYKGHSMSAAYMHRPYVLGFAHRTIADDVARYVNDCSGTTIEHVDLDSSVRIRMKKKININYLSCHVHKMDLESYLAIPFVHNVGLAIILQVQAQTRTEYVFGGLLVDPLVLAQDYPRKS